MFLPMRLPRKYLLQAKLKAKKDMEQKAALISGAAFINSPNRKRWAGEFPKDLSNDLYLFYAKGLS